MSRDKKSPIRIWVDGCFDMMHYGHANALRQAKELGDYLVVGVHNDLEIMKHKGIPVMKDQERLAAVAACKWVDLVVPNAPYVTSLEIMDQYNCDFCVHGDDISTAADGTDSYAAVKAAGRFREVKRTIGISTTELVGRMLLMTKETFAPKNSNEEEEVSLFPSPSSSISIPSNPDKKSPYTMGLSKILPTSKRIAQFSVGNSDPKSTDRIVYVDGSFDLFHIGHADLFKKAREFGDYLLVGVHDDATVSKIKGNHHPLMNLHERVLGVLSCKYVDEVIIGAPYSVTKEILRGMFNVHMVIHGATEYSSDMNGMDPYKLPKEMGMYKEINTDFSYLTATVVIERIFHQRQNYEERNRKKEAKELNALNNQKMQNGI